MKIVEIMYGEFQSLPLIGVYNSTREKNPFQRVIDQNKVDIIIRGLKEEEAKYGNITQTGVIHVAELNGQWFLLDGQHRLSAYYTLGKPENIMIQIWKYHNLSDMLQKFKDINNNTPIEEHVINASKTEQFDEKEKYDILINYVETNYKNLIKYSDRPQWPNINGEKFRKLVTYIPEFRDANKDNIITVFEQLNRNCKEKLMNGNKQDRGWVGNPQNEPKLYLNRFLIELWNAKASEIK